MNPKLVVWRTGGSGFTSALLAYRLCYAHINCLCRVSVLFVLFSYILLAYVDVCYVLRCHICGCNPGKISLVDRCR